ncbi:MAG: DNA repair protein RecO [Cyclobacteriaceae bacterium]|nr:DNA repair protein RecO [Cyclobacteriaceae bacterium]MCH8516126.1 DNA repair protein RecO [Cyclobacteriaceae bacterium]
MLYKTEGIVLGFIKYKESSIITRIYTERFGRVSYIVNGVRTAKSKSKAALYQPFNLLDMVVYHREKNDLQRISEARLSVLNLSIGQSRIKSSLALFLSEVLDKSLREESGDTALFEYVKQHILLLEDMPTAECYDFHLRFLSGFLILLGFGLQGADDFLDSISYERIDLPTLRRKSAILDRLFARDEVDLKASLTKAERDILLDGLLLYFKQQIEGFGQLKSIDIIRQVFHG